MHGLEAPAQFILVHNVIVDQGKIVKKFHCSGGRQGILYISADSLAGKQCQQRANFLSRHFQKIMNRFSQGRGKRRNNAVQKALMNIIEM
jgi:hypothetical protein